MGSGLAKYIIHLPYLTVRVWISYHSPYSVNGVPRTWTKVPMEGIEKWRMNGFQSERIPFTLLLRRGWEDNEMEEVGHNFGLDY